MGVKESDIVGVISSGIVRVAIRQVAHTYSPGCTINFQTDLNACESGTMCPKCIIVESDLIPEPTELRLAEMKAKNPDGRIFIIENKKCTGELDPYIFDCLNIHEPEEILKKRLRTFFTFHEKKYDNPEEILSDREKEIVKLVALGNTNKEISDNLYISPHTVITHRKNITAKLGIKTIAGLTVYAVLNGIINPDEEKL